MNTRQKIVGWETLKRKIARHRRQGETIAFTNGCFDILHFGHVSYLQQAKKANRILIVGLNSDRSIKKIKGPKRPIVREKERCAVLAALSCVDYVTIFNEPTPLKVIEALKPDVLIKGADWKGKDVAGSLLVEKVEYIKYLSQFSTTKMIETIREKH